MQSETASVGDEDVTDIDAVKDVPSVDSEDQREAYYSANFKSVLKMVLSDSPERHVISSNGVKTVERFMSLTGGSFDNSYVT